MEVENVVSRREDAWLLDWLRAFYTFQPTESIRMKTNRRITWSKAEFQFGTWLGLRLRCMCRCVSMYRVDTTTIEVLVGLGELISPNENVHMYYEAIFSAKDKVNIYIWRYVNDWTKEKESQSQSQRVTRSTCTSRTLKCRASLMPRLCITPQKANTDIF